MADKLSGGNQPFLGISGLKMVIFEGFFQAFHAQIHNENKIAGNDTSDISEVDIKVHMKNMKNMKKNYINSVTVKMYMNNNKHKHNFITRTHKCQTDIHPINVYD